jgi:hypothetical protein
MDVPVTLPLIVDTPLILNAKLLLSGVKETSKVEAPIPLFSMHVARDLEPITLIASAVFVRSRDMNANIRNAEDNDDRRL